MKNGWGGGAMGSGVDDGRRTFSTASQIIAYHERMHDVLWCPLLLFS
jgi:hypothetical protein